MAGQDKSSNLLLIIGSVAVAIFIILIFLVNHWVKVSLLQMQNQVPQAGAVQITPARPSNKNTNSIAQLMGQSTLPAQNKGQTKMNNAPKKIEILKEAPTLDKVLNE